MAALRGIFAHLCNIFESHTGAPYEVTLAREGLQTMHAAVLADVELRAQREAVLQQQIQELPKRAQVLNEARRAVADEGSNSSRPSGSELQAAIA